MAQALEPLGTRRDLVPDRPLPGRQIAVGGSPRQIAWELPFWICLAYWAIWPSTKIGYPAIASVPIDSRELALLALTGFYLLQAAVVATANRRYSIARPATPGGAAPWHRRLPLLTAGIIAYAAVSTNWSGMEGRDTRGMLYTLLATLAAAVLGYRMIAGRSPETVRAFLWRLTLFLTAVGLLYTAESVLSLGLRSEAGQQSDIGDFGIQRVRGPLFVASTGFFILLPAAAFAIQQLLDGQARRLLSVGAVGALIATILGLGSRGGLIVLALFFFFALLVRDSRKRYVIPVVAVILVVAAGFIYSNAQTDRLQSLNEEGRLETHRTSWQIAINRPLVTDLFGSGYGSYWPWYITEVDNRGQLYERGLHSDLVWNPYGPLLYHSHSVFVLLGVELGGVGLLYFAALWLTLGRLLARGIRGGPSALLAVGMTASGFSMFFDLFLFRTPQLNAVWWTFLFGALVLSDERQCARRADAAPPSFRATFGTDEQDIRPGARLPYPG